MSTIVPIESYMRQPMPAARKAMILWHRDMRIVEAATATPDHPRYPLVQGGGLALRRPASPSPALPASA